MRVDRGVTIFIADLSKELSILAVKNQQPELAHILRMAELEARRFVFDGQLWQAEALKAGAPLKANMINGTVEMANVTR